MTRTVAGRQAGHSINNGFEAMFELRDGDVLHGYSLVCLYRYLKLREVSSGCLSDLGLGLGGLYSEDI